MKRFDTAAPYLAVYVLIEREGKYLFVRRANTNWMDDHYGLPGGKVEWQEGCLAAAAREAREETGVEIAPEHLEHAVTLWRREDADDPAMEWCDIGFVARQWGGEPYNAEPHMHDSIAWFGLHELPENVVPSVRHIMTLFEQGVTYGEYDQFIAK